MRRLRAALLATSLVTAVAATTAAVAPAAVAAAPAVAPAAGAHSSIQGSGSSWSANAVNQWVADVSTNGLQVVFTSTGSAQGRKDFSYKTTDYGVSDIGYQGVDPVTQESDSPQGRDYAYLPIVAGGTAFPYQLKVSGQQVKNLRLSGTTLTKIFTNQIRSWADPAITADNNGHAFPDIAIIPVVHSEGSGSSYQFTAFMNTQYPSIWQPFLGKSTATEYFPRKDPAIAQNGSDGVMNFISSAAANGAIGYDEYSYALNKGYPVAKILNADGYYTAPDQYNVAVALQDAIINQDKSDPNVYLTQDLHKVYGTSSQQAGSPRTAAYPLSSYSYLILPTGSGDPRMTTAKRQTLVDFLSYSICDGQKEMGPIGYSPLPVNLVSSGFDQLQKLKAADGGVDLTNRSVQSCNNPTFDGSNTSKNKLAEIAPTPPACDKQGAGPCAAIGTTKAAIASNGGSTVASTTGQGGTTANGTTAGGATSGGGTTAAGGTTTNADGTTAAAGGDATAAGGADLVDANGVPVTSGVAGGQVGDATVVAANLPKYASSGSSAMLAALAVALLIGSIVVPPLVGFVRSGRSSS